MLSHFFISSLSFALFIGENYDVGEKSTSRLIEQYFSNWFCYNDSSGIESFSAVNNEVGTVYEARVEDGKLFYENKWFHKGQHIFMESKEHGQERYIGYI